MIKADCYDKCYAVAKEGIADKEIRKEKFGAIIDTFVDGLGEAHQYDHFLIRKY